MGFLENLPEEIIHRILSFLNPKDAARTSTLCKIWFRAWQTQPNLECDERYFRRRNEFVDYIDSTVMRYQEMKISIEKLKIFFYYGMHIHFGQQSQLLDKWIGIAMNIGLKKLELVSFCRYRVPAKVFEQLEDISINECIIEKINEIPNKIPCFSLMRLSLSKAFCHEGALENILSICQNIEFLNLDRVLIENQGKLKVQAGNLKELKVECKEGQHLEVKAPILESFTCIAERLVTNASATLSFSTETTQNIKFLRLRKINVTSPIEKDQFPKLEDFIIDYYCSIKHLHLSSQSLKNLKVIYPCELEYMRVDCNLDKFQFQFYSNMNFIPKIVFTNPSRHSVSSIHLCALDSSRFWRLKNLLKDLIPSKISLTIEKIIDETAISDGIRLEKEYELAIPIHQLSLGRQGFPFFNITSDVYYHHQYPVLLPLNFPAMIDGIFWTCRPTLIKLHQCPPCDEFSRFLVRKLMVERDHESYCGSQKTKDWERDLKEVKIDLFIERWKGLKKWVEKSEDSGTSMYSIKDEFSIEEIYSKEDISFIRKLFFCITCDWENSSIDQEVVSS